MHTLGTKLRHLVVREARDREEEGKLHDKMTVELFDKRESILKCSHIVMPSKQSLAIALR